MAKQTTTPVLLTTGLVTQHTVSSGQQPSLVVLHMVHTHSSVVNVEVQFIDSGQTANDKYIIVETQTGTNELAAGETRDMPRVMFKDAGAFLQARADVASKIAFFASILEESV